MLASTLGHLEVLQEADKARQDEKKAVKRGDARAMHETSVLFGTLIQPDVSCDGATSVITVVTLPLCGDGESPRLETTVPSRISIRRRASICRGLNCLTAQATAVALHRHTWLQPDESCPSLCRQYFGVVRDGLITACASFGHVPCEALFDNMKTVVLERVWHDLGWHQFRKATAIGRRSCVCFSALDSSQDVDVQRLRANTNMAPAFRCRRNTSIEPAGHFHRIIASRPSSSMRSENLSLPLA